VRRFYEPAPCLMIKNRQSMRHQQLRGLSPDTMELTTSLYRKPGLLDRWNADARTIATIHQIGATNEPAAIRDLMSFGLSRDSEVRVAARLTIQHLFSLVPVEAMPLLDEWLRRTWGQLEDWYGLRADVLSGLELKNRSDQIFLGLIASHRNGFVRAEAVRILGLDESEAVVPFLLVRLVDWVNEVRSAAEGEVLRRLTPRFAKILVDSWPLIDRLAAGTRFNRSILRRIDELLQAPECTDQLRRGMELPSRSIRRRCFLIAAQAPEFKIADIIARAIIDPDVLVRRWGFTAGTELLPHDRIELRRQAARDPYAPIRRLAFEALEADPASHLGDFEPFLLDRSTPIRRECQTVAARRFAVIPADFYRERMQTLNAKQTEVAVLGIAETGSKQDEAAITALLRHRSARIRRAAIRALRILGVGFNSDILLNIVCNDVPAVMREAALTLFAERKTSGESIWAAAARNPDHRARAAVLNVLQIAGKWTQIRLYLEAVADTEPSVSRRSVELLSLWVRKSNASFTQPTATDKITLQRSIAAMGSLLPQGLSRELSFIIETSLR